MCAKNIIAKQNKKNPYFLYCILIMYINEGINDVTTMYEIHFDQL